MKSLSVLIPAYNEEKSIEKTLAAVSQYLSASSTDYEIIVSDDGSTDQTAILAEKLALNQPRIKLVKNEHHGKAAAINTVLPQANKDYCLLMDADGSAAISEIEKLEEALAESHGDAAIGSRQIHGAQRHHEPLYRHLLGRGFNLIVRLFTGLKFQDTQCGFKLFKTSILKQLSRKSLIMNKRAGDLKTPLVTAFDVELLLLAKNHGYPIVEVPINWRYVPSQRVDPIKDSWRMLLDVLNIRLNLFLGRYN